MVGLFYMLERSHLPTVYLFLSRLFALTKQLRPVLCCPEGIYLGKWCVLIRI